MRYIALVSLLMAAGLAAGQNTSAPVTFSTRAARASQVVKALGALAKVDLQVSPQTENEVLVVSVKDVPLIDVMTRIATVASGEWKREGSVYRLVASQTVRNLEQRDETAKRIALIRKGIESRITNEEKTEKRMAKLAADAAAKSKSISKVEAKPTKKSGEEENKADEDQAAAPNAAYDEHAITELLKEIDPSVLAQVDAGDRIVFSTEPTRTQRSLGQNATEVVNEFIQKHDSTVTATPPDVTEQLSGLSDQQAEMIKQMMKRQMSKIGQASKALLIASSSPMAIFGISNSIQLELRIYDSKGGVAFSGTSTLETDENDFMAKVRAQAEEAAEAAAAGKSPADALKPTVPPAKSTPIELSEDSKALEEAAGGMKGDKFSMKLGQDLRKKLFSPSIYDPLSFIETDEILAYAKLKGKPLVANLPDQAFGSITTGIGGEKKSLEAYAEEIDKGTVMTSVKDESFTVIKPAFPAKSRVDRLDRVALTTLMQAAREKGVPSLEDLCAYAQVAPNPAQGGVGQTYVMLFVPGAISMGLEGMTSWDMLRFYGQLSPEMRASLSNGGKLAISGLTPSQRSLVERMTYGSESQLTVEEPGKKSDDTPFWMRMAGIGMGTDYKTEPTEVVPNGLPADGFLDLRDTSEPFAAPIADQDTATLGIMGVLGPEELGLFKMFRSMAGAEQISAMMPKFDKLHVGERTLLNFSFHLAPQVSMKQTLKDHHLSKDGTVYSEDNLPSDLQKKVAQREEEYKKSPMGAIGSFMGNTQGIHP